VPDCSLDQVTGLLLRWRQGDEHALDSLLPIVYKDLRRIASRLLKNERRGHTLQATALVHEAYLELADKAAIQWENRAHFLAVSARAMRQILIHYARRRNRGKRGGGIIFTSLHEEAAPAKERSVDMLVLDQALDRLVPQHPRKARVLELKIFGGMENSEIAEILQISTITVIRDWNMAIALLGKEMEGLPTP
jgi:RNA polymerase sigma factor (TIGR02999 family)